MALSKKQIRFITNKLSEIEYKENKDFIESLEKKYGIVRDKKHYKMEYVAKDVYVLYADREFVGYYRVRKSSYNWEVKPPKEKFNLSAQTVIKEPGDAGYAYRYNIARIDTEGMRKKLAEMILDDHRVLMNNIIDIAYKVLGSLYGFLIFDDEEE